MRRESEDIRFMTEALRLAARLPGRPWPNPPVGAVVVRDGEIVGRGAHLGAGTDHAERLALAEAGDRARGATLYVTLEPCNHRGRTEACAPLVTGSGVARLVVGVADPNPRVAGGGLAAAAAAGIAVELGACGRESLEMIWPFAASEAFARPFVLLKTAVSLDGRFAPPPARDLDGAPFYLTGEAARADVHRLRRWCDVVLVGEGTARADRPRLDGRLAGEDCPAADPLAGWVDSDLSLAIDDGRAPDLICAGVGADPDRVARLRRSGVTVLLCAERDGRVDPAALRDELAAFGSRVVMIEGGPRLAAAFLAAGAVDRWVAYTAPLLLGDGPAWPAFAVPEAAADYRLTDVARLGPDLRQVRDRVSFDAMLAELTDPRRTRPDGEGA